jgi:repressor LexA
MKWESGFIENMRRDKVALLAQALKVSPLWIMGIEDKNVKSGVVSIPLLDTIAAGTPILIRKITIHSNSPQFIRN